MVTSAREAATRSEDFDEVTPLQTEREYKHPTEAYPAMDPHGVRETRSGEALHAHSRFVEADADAELLDEEADLNLERMEKKAIEEALRRNRNRRKLAAVDLGISERTLYRKIKDYGLEE